MVIRFFRKDIYRNRAMMTAAVVDLFWKRAQQENARFAPSAFVGMQLNRDIRYDLTTMPAPFLLVWGQFAAQTPFREAATVHALRPELPMVVLPSGDLPNDENPERFTDALLRFVQQLD